VIKGSLSPEDVIKGSPSPEDVIKGSLSPEDMIRGSLSPLGRGKGEGGFEDIGDESDGEILSWQEILIMRDSGLIDFGSHTLYHNRIFTGPEIVDFLGPSYSKRPYDYPAVPAGFEISVIEEESSSFFGMPVYSNDSPMSGRPRFIDDPGFRKECLKYYRERFGNPPSSPLDKGRIGRWEKEMFSFALDYRKRNHLSERFLTIEEMAREIYDNLFLSKKILEERLGRPVNHLCYPFGIWSTLSNDMAKRSGYLSSFCAYIPGKPINRSGDDPYNIVRLKDDYIFRLPGKGRKSLIEIFTLKMKRRLRGQWVY